MQPTLEGYVLTTNTGAGYKCKNEQGGKEKDVSVAIDNIIASQLIVPPIKCIERKCTSNEECHETDDACYQT